MTELMKIPARILIQIREGRLNLLSDFEIEVESTAEREDGTLEHKVAVDSVIRGISIALREKIRELREGARDQAMWDEWLLAVRDWIFEEAES